MTDRARTEAEARWSHRHDGLDPTASAWVSGWVRLTDALAGPLARRGVAADTVTYAGVALSAAVPLISSAHAGWPLLATPVLVLAAVFDGVDGALASRSATASRWGRVLDPLADRCSDLLLVLTLVVLGAPVWTGVALAVLTLLLEQVRATAQVAGLRGPGAVTWWERPARVIVVSFAAGLSGLVWCARSAGVDRFGTVDGPLLATVAAGAGSVLAAVGLVHLLVAVRRRLTG